MFLQSRQVLLRFLLVVLIIYSGYQCVDFFMKALPAVSGFVKAGGDHDVLRSEKIPYHKSVLWASRSMVPGQTVRFSREGLRMMDVIAISYMLYPARVVDDGLTVLEFHKNSDGSIYTTSQAPLGTSVDYQYAQRSFLTEFAIFVAVSFVFIFFGGNFLRCLGVHHRALGRVWFWGASYLTGFVMINWIYWIGLMAGINLSLPVVWGVLILLYIISLFFSQPVLDDSGSVEKSHVNPAHDQLVWPQPWMWGAGAVSAGILVMVVLVTISVPITVWDEMLIWILRAKMLFYEGKIDFDYLSKTNVYYPNLWPLHIHVFFKAVGGCYSEALKWVSASVFLVFVSQLTGLLRVLNFKSLPYWLPVCFYLVVFMNFIFFTALPENIFFALSLGLVLALMLWLRDQKKSFLVLALVMAMGLSGVKFEGGLIVLAIVSCAAFVGFFSGVSLRRLGGLSWLLIPSLVPWFWTGWLKFNGHPYSIYHFTNAFTWENISAIVQVVMRSLLQGKNLFVLIVMSLVFIVTANRRPWEPAERLLGLTAIIFIGFSFCSVVFWPINDIRLYFPEVLDRLFLRATPFVALLWLSRVFDRKLS